MMVETALAAPLNNNTATAGETSVIVEAQGRLEGDASAVATAGEATARQDATTTAAKPSAGEEKRLTKRSSKGSSRSPCNGERKSSSRRKEKGSGGSRRKEKGISVTDGTDRPPVTRTPPKKRGLRKSTSLSDFKPSSLATARNHNVTLQRKGSAPSLLAADKMGSESERIGATPTRASGMPMLSTKGDLPTKNFKEMKKGTRTRTVNTEISKSRSASPQRTLTSGLEPGTATATTDLKPPSLAGTEGSLATSSLDVSEKHKKLNSMRDGSTGRRKTLEEAAGERKSSRRALLMDSSSRKTLSSRQRMGDGSQALDASRKSSSSMEASDKHGSRRRALLDASRERRKMMTDSSEVHTSMNDMRQTQKLPSRKASSHGSKPKKLADSIRAKKAAGLVVATKNEEEEDIPEMEEFGPGEHGDAKKAAMDSAQMVDDNKQEESTIEEQGVATIETKATSAASATNSTPEQAKPEGGDVKKTGNKDAFGFPASSGFSESTNFGHLPNFAVADFSFRDRSFPFDTKTTPKLDDTKAAELSSIQEAKSKEDKAKEPVKETNAANKSAAAAPKLPPRVWICASCREEHDESDLQFCGMCGADRPKITPQPKKSLRKSKSLTPGGKREGKKGIRRPITTQSKDDSGVHSHGSRKSRTMDRPSSTGAIRKVRSRDKAGMTTPRSRSKGKVRSKDKDVAMVVKCLDQDDGEAMDMEMLNQQLTTFESLHPPMTPMKSKKNSLRRCQSDVTEGVKSRMGAGRIPTSNAPQTPRGLGKKKGPIQRSKSFADAPGTPIGGPPAGRPALMRKPSVRQAIPRRAKSSTTEYLQHLKQNNIQDQSGHSTGVHSTGAQSTGAIGGRPSLAGVRPSLMKTASTRLLGGLSGLSSTFTMGGMSKVVGGVSNVVGDVSNAMGNLPGVSLVTSKSKENALLLDSDDEGDDSDEFANELQQTAKPDETVILRDFSTNDVLFSKSSVRQRASRNILVSNDDDGGGAAPQTPRRRRASIAAARQAHAEGVTRTPRRRRNSVEPKARSGIDDSESAGRGRPRGMANRSCKRGGLPFGNDDATGDKKSAGSGSLDYYDIDIDIDEDDDGLSGDALGCTTTPRRTRERLARPMIRRQGTGTSLAKSDHGAVTPKGLNARSRIRRASITVFQVGALPDLDAPEPAKAPATPGMLCGRRQIRRASLGGTQVPIEATQEPEPVSIVPASTPVADKALPAGRGHGQAMRGAGRRAGRRGTSNPLLHKALAHMSQDPTHAVRSDIQEEWKRQEQMEGMRKKAKALKKRYQGDTLGSPAQPEAEPAFDADFDAFGPPAGFDDLDDGEESGADLELAHEDQDLSDISSHDGAE